MESALILTLGHGASAIFIENGVIKCGYQLERITGVKGDSRFPALCIEEIEKKFDIPHDIPVYVSHWHPSGLVDNMTDKHWNKHYLKSKFPDALIECTSIFNTHHDTHAWSALAYNHTMSEAEHIMVADGFGTMGEVISIYSYSGSRPVLLRRLFGFDGSLGLLYQYATDYVGWKQNQDEWKLNACANQCSQERMKEIRPLARGHALKMVKTQLDHRVAQPDDPITNLGALSHTHQSVVDTLSSLFSAEDKPGIAYFLQLVVEEVVLYWIEVMDIKRCTFVGGCFMNVQLNGSLAYNLESISVMPLSGDEGAGLGMYKRMNNNFFIPDDLSWGHRDLDNIDDLNIPRLKFTVDPAKTVTRFLNEGCIVNIVRGSMEFGPRAYCNTSTLALPTRNNHRYINELNARNTHMPMCPVVTWGQYISIFQQPSDIKRSIEHMIIAVPYKTMFKGSYPGVEYKKPNGVVTGRPQVVDSDHWMQDVLVETGPLINTSFNNHGQPIVYNIEQILEAHNFMLGQDVDNRVVTVIDISGATQDVSSA